jgi:hypothetical protein
MIVDLINNTSYQKIVTVQIREIIKFLVEHSNEFGITANIKGVSFNPELPSVISSKLAPFPMFVLAHYSFESLNIYDDYLEFEAGFGKENFGSVVKIPLKAIFQIVVDESILYLNPVATLNNIFENTNNIAKSKSKLTLASKKL